MNRGTFLKTLLGLVAVPTIVAKVVSASRVRVNPAWVNAPYESVCWELGQDWRWYYIKDNDDSEPWNRCSNADCNIYRPRSPEEVLPILFHRCKL